MAVRPTRGSQLLDQSTRWRRARRRGALALLLIFLSVPSGCATFYVVDKWNPHRKGQIELQGVAAMPNPSLRWELSIERSNFLGLIDSSDVERGTVSLAPPLEGCDTVELLVLHNLGPPETLKDGEGIKYACTDEVAEGIESQVRQTLADGCTVLLSAGGLDGAGHPTLYASTPSGRFDAVALGDVQSNPAWALALPLAVTYDVATGAVAVVAVAVLVWASVWASEEHTVR